MDPKTMEIIELLLILAKQGPAIVSFAENTYALFKSGSITEDDLKKMWMDAGNAAKAAEDKWAKAGVSK